jgi:hypothetical protein
MCRNAAFCGDLVAFDPVQRASNVRTFSSCATVLVPRWRSALAAVSRVNQVIHDPGRIGKLLTVEIGDLEWLRDQLVTRESGLEEIKVAVARARLGIRYRR